MRGIVLAGGSGTRLYPLTLGVSKQLLPIHDKPMIYYPLSVLLLAGIRDILIITTPHEHELFVRVLGDGSRFGVSLSYAKQESPDGLAQALLIGEHFIDNKNTALILGDNIFHGHAFSDMLESACARVTGSTIFAKSVQDPSRFGIVELGKNNIALSIEEKPEKPKSNYAVTGLYFYDKDAVSIAKEVKPSPRGELEITAVNDAYLKNGNLHVELLGRGFAWLDTGTHDTLAGAGEFVRIMEQHQGMKIACLEEIAYTKGFLSKAELEHSIDLFGRNQYGAYLQTVLKRKP